jgi:hypothetical protein
MNTKRIFSGALLLSAVFSTSACIPLRILERDGGAAKIIDAETAEPIAGAKVIVPTWRVIVPRGRRGNKVHTFEAISDAEGAFSVPAKKGWGLVFLAPDGGAFFAQGICIEKPGYETLEMDPFESKDRFPEPIQISGKFSLKRASKDKVAGCFSARPN